MRRKLWILSENKKRQLNIRSIIYLVCLKKFKCRKKIYTHFIYNLYFYLGNKFFMTIETFIKIFKQKVHVQITYQEKSIVLVLCLVCKSVSDRTGIISKLSLSSRLGFLKNNSLNNVPSVEGSSRSFLPLIRTFCIWYEIDSLSNSSKLVL